MGANIDFASLNGFATLVADDEQFLGRISSSKYDSDSIMNEYGPYGSRYSLTSIFNPYSMYGSPYSTLSPFNRYTGTPPKVFLNDIFIGYLTLNEYISPTINVYFIGSFSSSVSFSLNSVFFF